MVAECGWGELVDIQIINVQHGKRAHSKVFIHYKTFPDKAVENHLSQGNEIKVYYNNTFFWKVRKSKYVHKEEPKKKFELVN